MWSGVVVFQSVSHVWLLVTPTECGTPGLMAPWPSLSPGVYSKLILWASDAIQPSHPLLPPSSLALCLSQHQGLFQRISSSHQVAKVLELQLQHQSFQLTPRTDLLMDWLDLLAVQATLKSLLQHHSSKSIDSSALSFLYGLTLTSIHDHWKNHSHD